MDEFGVLVESIGFKSQTRSTPLSKLKSEPTKQNYQNAPPPPPPSSTHQNTGGFDFGHQDFMFHSNQYTNQFGAGNGVDLDAFFVGGSGASASASDDIFGMNSINNSSTNNGHGFGDLLSGFANPTTIGGNSVKGNSGQSSFAEDPLSFFESPASRAVEYSGKNSSPIDQLEAFAMGSSQNNGSQRLDVKISNEAITRVQEKLSNLKPFGKEGNATSHANIKVTLARKGERDAKVTPGSQPFSQREKLSVRGHSNEAKSTFESEDSFGSWFSNDSQANSSRGPKSEIKDPVVGSLFSGRNQGNVENPSSQSLQRTKKAPTNRVDDFMFFGEPAPSAVEFFEIEGEPEERRRARFNQHIRTKERMAKALSEKNQRDLQAQHEQEQRHSLAESMDNKIKRWSAGKVGNLRALLSSLQDVLWPECGWQPVSLTDMITSVSVKKVYHKATLCVHPDKVQQKGATVQQKYIAEKVFDLLKEAWNKFNAEELR